MQFTTETPWLNETSEPVYVGVAGDFGELEFYFPDLGARAAVRNAIEDIDLACRRFQSKPQYLFVLLSDRNYARLCSARMVEHNLPVALVNARLVYDFSSQRGKEDCADAEAISVFAATNKLVPQAALSVDKLAIDAMVARYFQLAHLRSCEKYNLDRTTHQEAQVSIQKVLDFVESELSQVFSRLGSLLVYYSASQREIEIMRSAGLPDWSILILLERLPELGKVDQGKIVKLVGVVPDNPLHGRDGIRELLFVVTEGLVSTHPKMQAAYAKLIASGKVHKVAITVCLRKLIIRLNVCIKKDELWNEQLDFG